ncbi:Eco57I restriction-modification methylase domain-containing protein [Clostridium neuense]|uniref:site-specific DNA-methyltransferase (adenine-specific) n=1 Tax=Clostridium neuense TaxID=1728934 RepID=A0ABW8TGZ3_9CLOT
MLENFKNEIYKLYDVLNSTITLKNKLLKIDDLKKKYSINEELSNAYYKYISLSREKGVVYTPHKIAQYIIQNTISCKDIIENPFIKIIDPACGSGNIILPAFKYLKKIYVENLEEINLKNNLNLDEMNLNYHIVKNNLFGFDIDKTAIKILSIDLFYESSCLTNNFLQKDFLIDNIAYKYDIFISNPPYIGLKAMDKNYSLNLKKMYYTYKDKGDISYCFFQKSMESVTENGKLGFITSRYFLESLSGEKLRKVLRQSSSIYKIVDFYGIRPFKNVGIDPIMIFLSNKYSRDNYIKVIKPHYVKGSSKKYFYNSLFSGSSENMNEFLIKQSSLDDNGWILINAAERNIIRKIEQCSHNSLYDICNSYQGIITGCDKAFIVDSETIENEGIEKEFIRRWIKSKVIRKNYIEAENKYIIYSDEIKDIEAYPNIQKHLSSYKAKLSGRRECVKGIRAWYELQWGRNKDIFEGEKIIFPFKSSSNRFALDKGSYFSADIYSLILKDDMPFNYEYLLYILNSKVYEFYFKTFAKKLGNDLYEYYPNTIMKLYIPDMNKFNCNYTEEGMYDVFGFTEDEVRIIENSFNKESKS